ncbi:MAG: cobyrinate a,c-diamide synthase [Deltaproteobacteria bacterium]|nr:cobyrinate a,c-diamide synthase [Deltaproteobacteria bacterium]MBW1995177.1 cobyrinate a,c-diamide synthase [Deltaproteobacteria bacterium]MBW2154915.1 cobyrinate a,c-diamide synthase [Deltaproteobacteria bacterium]
MKGLVVAATKSGSGKTTVTLGLIASFKRRGFDVAPFKVGPDFIDPGHHSRVSGCVSRNLDGWMLSKSQNLESFRNHTASADIAVVEGVMGLFDGYDGRSESGSTAQIAKWLGLPVLLIVDANSMARSAAAIVQGFERFDRELKFAGVVFNNVASRRHLRFLKEAVEGNTKMPFLGGIMRDETISIPHRHLGLVTREDHPLTEDTIVKLADMIDESIRVDALLDLLPSVKPALASEKIHIEASGSKVRIGIARDNAFCFYYQDNLDLLKAHGAEIVYFSPMGDTALPDDLDGLYFGGGYPELYAQRLSENRSLRRQIRERHDNGMPIYGECGGFMYLCSGLVDLQGNHYPMVGCFPFTARMCSGLRQLGYREVVFVKETILGKPQQTVRGHEFHYSELIPGPHKPELVYRVSSNIDSQASKEGFQIGRCLGSYIHLHFASCLDVADYFVKVCEQYKQERFMYCETEGN